MVSHKTLLLQGLLALIVWTLWFVLGGGTALFGVIAEHWTISVTMVFGSFIAGATAEGGGAVAFPVFTKVLQIAPADARVFALAIQSVGMTAASLLILAMRVKVDWIVLRWASLGGLIGLGIGATLLAPVTSPPMTRMIFTVMQATFAVALIALNQREPERHDRVPRDGARERLILLGTGVLGGLLSGLVGTGLDIVTFSVVVLLFRVSEKVVTPTSVLLMAGNSLVGFALYGWGLDAFTPQVRDWWLAAVPVVVVGAPLGAVVCSLLSRRVIAQALVGLIAVEVATSLILIPLDIATAAVSGVALLVLGTLYVWMYRQETYVPESR